MQLVYKHALAQHPVMVEAIKMMFDAMAEFRLGKSSTLFSKVAKDLGHMVLMNKKDQTTRFVRSAARGIKTFLQNLPTIIMLLNINFKEVQAENNMTEAKVLKQKVAKLSDPRFIL